MTYLDVGQGDCTLLQCDGQVMLIDAAEGNQANKITAYLKQHGVTAIDYLVCTHAHADHCGGMKAVVAAFPVRTLYSSVTSSSNGAFQRVMRAAETANLAITVPNVGDTFSLGSATVTVLGPQKHYSDVNNQSLILRVDYGSNAFLFTGDAEYESETDVLDAGEDVRCDVIKPATTAAAPPRATACCTRRSRSTPSSAAARTMSTATRTTTRSAACATRT